VEIKISICPTPMLCLSNTTCNIIYSLVTNYTIIAKHKQIGWANNIKMYIQFNHLCTHTSKKLYPLFPHTSNNRHFEPPLKECLRSSSILSYNSRDTILSHNSRKATCLPSISRHDSRDTIPSYNSSNAQQVHL